MIFRRYLTIPRQGLFNLTNDKQLISITGKDSSKFLNGLLTSKLLPTFIKKNQYTISDQDSNGSQLAITDDELEKNWGIIHEDSFLENDDVDKIGIRRDGIYSMLLNSKGRVMTDLFVYPTPFSSLTNQPSYVLELDKSLLGKVFMMLKLHKLKSQLQITKLSSPNLWYYYNDSLEFNQLLSILEENYFNNLFNKSVGESLTTSINFMRNELIFNKDTDILGFALDNRSYLNGIKFITNTSNANEIFNKDFIELMKTDLNLQPTSILDLRRNLKGLVEKKDLIATETLPFEHNIDYMNGISYDKGCYVGQELTIRTKNHGIIRKRIFPFKIITDSKDEIDESFNHDMINTEIPLPEQQQEEEQQQQHSSSPFANSAASPRKRRAKSLGKILQMNFNYGYLLMSLNYLQDLKEYKDFQLDSYTLRVLKPDYFVDEYDDDEDI